MKFANSSNNGPENRRNDTSWGGVANWYDGLVEGEGSYQRELILPNLLRLVAPATGMNILDLACGQGFFSRAFAGQGAHVTGIDISKELIEIAKKNSPASIQYHVGSADSLAFLNDGQFDVAAIVLAIQNIEHFSEAFAECARVLKSAAVAEGVTFGGKLLLVLNHPAFRIPGESSWQFDEKEKIQYRRVDSYLGESKTVIDMEPGKSAVGSEKASPEKASSVGEKTVSFHRPLQAYFKALEKSSFMVKRLEEWTSHKTSEPGPRQSAENRARKEIPLFLMIEAVKIAR